MLKLFKKTTKEDFATMMYNELVNSEYTLTEKSEIINMIRERFLQHVSEIQTDADNAINKLV